MVLQVMNGVKVMRMKSLSLLVAVLAGGVFGTEYHWYAKPASSGNASGSDFANACTLATAIDKIPAKNDNTDTYVIHMGAGSYDRHGYHFGGNRSGRVVFRSDDGNGNYDTTNVLWHGGETRERPIVVQNNANATMFYVSLEGITFTNCAPSQYAGGFVHNQLPKTSSKGCTIRNCRFIDGTCQANSGGAVKLYGANVYDCWFENCTAPKGSGGAIAPDGGAASIVSNCWFVNCSSLKGGAVFMDVAGSVLVDCVISNNYTFKTSSGTEGNGGGGVVAKGRVERCRFIGNTGVAYGGGLYLSEGSLIDSEILGNQTSGAHGGGLFVDFNSQVLNSTIRGNMVTNSLHSGGGIAARNKVLISNCVVCANSAYEGAGLYVYDTKAEEGKTAPAGEFPEHRVTVRDTKIFENVARIPVEEEKAAATYTKNDAYYGHGGGIWFQHYLTVDGCNIYSNTAYSFNRRYAHAGAGIGTETPSPSFKILNSEIYANLSFRSNYWQYAVSGQGGETYGGGIHVGTGAAPSDAYEPVVSNCYIHGNRAQFGNEIYCGAGHLSVRDCILGNPAETRALGASGNSALFLENATSCLVRNTLFADNSQGTHVHLFRSFPPNEDGTMKGCGTFENCTFVGSSTVGMSYENGVQKSSGLARGLACVNCLFENTWNTTSFDAVPVTNVLFTACSTKATVDLNVYPGSTKNIHTTNYHFNDAAHGDYTMRGSSPCVDKGIVLDWMVGAKALNGEDRIIGLPDIGCYEFRPNGSVLIIR